MATLVTTFSPALSSTVAGQTNQLKSLTQLRAELRLKLRSPEAAGSGERNRWTDAELDFCLIEGMRKIAGLVKLEGALEFTLIANERDYLLPAFVQSITRIQRRGFQRLITIESIEDRGSWKDITGYRFMPPLLRMDDLYSDETDCRVDYRGDLQIVPAPVDLADAVDANDTVLTVPVPTDFPVPGVVRLGTELIWYGTAGFTGLEQCIRGYLGTVAAAHDAAVDVDPVPLLDGPGLHVLLTAAQLEAHLMRMNDASGADLQRALTMIQQCREDLLRDLRSITDPAPVGQLSNTHPFRPKPRRIVQ